jgi:nitroreductase
MLIERRIERPDMSDSSNSGSAAIIDLLRLRRSTRALSPRPIELAVLWRLLEAARWAPSAQNEQPWRFIVVRRDTEQFGHLISTMHEYNRMWAKNASVLIAAVVRKSGGNGQPENPFALYDLGQSVAMLTVQAQSEEISIRQIGAFDSKKAGEYLEIPSGSAVFTVLAMGYEGDPDELPENMKQMELAPRVRKPLFEIAFSEKWNKPLT